MLHNIYTMPPPTHEPRIRVIMLRRRDGKHDTGTSSTSKSCVIRGVDDEKWLMDAFIKYIEHLQLKGYPISIVQNTMKETPNEQG